MDRLVISIVVYNSPLGNLRQTISFLEGASEKLIIEGVVENVVLTIVDNASDPHYRAALKAFLDDRHQTGPLTIDVRWLSENKGYGLGHNMVGVDDGDFRLILNPDVFLAPDALIRALIFMQENPKAGLLVPRVLDAGGNLEYLCKRYPTVMDLALRGFAPAWLRKIFKERLDRYEMRDLDWSRPHFQVQLASGCCLLMRGEVWRALGGFSPDYFMYFEDFDLSMRVRELTPIAYVPGFQVTHLGGDAARKGWRHIVWFVRSAWVFFNQYGWRFW